MEEVFEQLIKETTPTKYPAIHQNSCDAKGILESASSLAKCSQSDLRHICFSAFQYALETKQPKLVSLAISGMHKLLRDNQFYGKPEGADENTWLVCQLMNAIDSIALHPADVQAEILKIILSMCCLPNLSLSGHTVVGIVGVCGLAYGRGNATMKPASQSAAIQAIVSFLNLMKMQSSNECGKTDENLGETMPIYDQIVPIIYFIAEKLTEAHKQREDKKCVDIPSVFLLECAQSLIQALNNQPKKANKLQTREISAPVYCSTLVISALWQRLCPSLIALLGTPVSSCVARGTGRMQGQSGRGSGATSTSTIFDTQEAKAIYSVSCHLVVTMGNVGEMRPILESLFHRMLLYPPPQARHDVLKVVADLLRNPEHLAQLAGPILFADPRNALQCDLGLFRLIMDSLTECCTSNDTNMQMVIIDCVCGLLGSLEVICKGHVLSTAQIAHINTQYLRLEDVDYSGPLIYGNQLGLPKYGYSQTVLSDQHATHDDNTSSSVQSSQVSDVAEEDLSEINSETCSNSSGDTEGPEDLPPTQELLDEDESRDQQKQDERRLKLSQNLGSRTNLKRIGINEHQRECENAKHFCSTLCSLLPSLLAIRSTIEVDQAIVEFSSKYCQGVLDQSQLNDSTPIIINADGIYLATYSALSLNLQLMTNGHYCQLNTCAIMTKEQFVETVFASGVLVYLSVAWVGRVYEHVVQDSFLQRAGYSSQSPYNCALINLLTDLQLNMICTTLIDMDGVGSVEEGSQMISDYRRLAKAAKNVAKTNAVLAGQKLSRRIVTCCWESIVAMQEALLKKLEQRGGLLTPIRLLLSGENARKQECRKAQQLLILCLNCLQASARLANLLGLQKRCGVVFWLLSSACLPMDERNPIGGASRSGGVGKKPLRLHRAHVLSFHVMMECGLELGSHTSHCWNHLFRCSLYLAELERRYFNDADKATYSGHSLAAASQMSAEHVTMRKESSFNECTIESILAETEDDTNTSGFLSPQHSGRVLSCLTLLVDRFFESAANQLNLAALETFLTQLCAASQNQLFNRRSQQTSKSSFLNWSKKKLSGGKEEQNWLTQTFLLHRVGEAMLKIVKSGRPLIHMMRTWSIVGRHLLEAACHKDSKVSKKAIGCIHDVVNNLLGSQVELPHFHFNEALFKPFENLLCLELCDLEVQDQIFSSLCEFVESCNADVKSGWRPLFGALKCVRVSPIKNPRCKDALDRVAHLGVVNDVFEAFLATDNILVFANAALDCILCLVKHVRARGDTVVEGEQLIEGDLCVDALRYLYRIGVVLCSMHEMPACPIFVSIHKVYEIEARLVDAHLPGVDQEKLSALQERLLGASSNRQSMKVDYACLWPRGCECALQNLDPGTGILAVWYVLLEGLTSAAMLSPQRHQPQVVDTLFGLIAQLHKGPGPGFGGYCISHLLLPCMQDWLRNYVTPGQLQPFKQYVGLVADVVVQYINETHSAGFHGMLLLMLQQMMVVLVECISQPNDVARLGCSCIRHITLSCGPFFNWEMWQVVVYAIHRASQVCLFPLYQLMEIFERDSVNFYGDVGEVKVAARRDSTPQESHRLRQLSLQVFQLDSQQCLDTATVQGEDRSFSFLIFDHAHDETDEHVLRVPFKAVILGLLSSQMILQTLGNILVQGSAHVVPSLANVLLQPASFGDEAPWKKKGLPAMLGFLTDHQRLVVLDSLELCFKASLEFDHRPGLKFLIQKVAQTDRAANLYKQAGASWTLRVLTIFDLIFSQGKNMDCVKDSMIKKETFIELLSDSLWEVCDKYVQLVSAQEELSAVDKMHDAPLFFLTIPADEFATSTQSLRASHPKINECQAAQSSCLPKHMTLGASGAKQSLVEQEQQEAEEEERTKAFAFADLIVDDSSSDSDCESAQEQDGVAGVSESMYSMATDKHLSTVMHHYRRHKSRHSFALTNDVTNGARAVPPQVDQHRSNSLMKDGEARVKVWTEMVVTVFDLISQLEECEMRSILPRIFPSLQSLTAHAQDPHLRQVVAEMLGRVGRLYGFGQAH